MGALREWNLELDDENDGSDLDPPLRGDGGDVLGDDPAEWAM